MDTEDQGRFLRLLKAKRASIEREEQSQAESEAELARLAEARRIEAAVSVVRSKARELLADQLRQRDGEVRRAVGAVVDANRRQVGPLLSVCLAAYMRKKRATKSWQAKTVDRWEFMGRLLIEGLGDRPITEYTSNDLIGLLEDLQRYPANATKFPELAGLTFRQLLAVKGFKRLSDGTVSDHMSRISGFFSWALREPDYHLASNPALGLQIKNVVRVKRMPFVESQLVAMFSHESYRTGVFLHPHYYWLIPIALLTGMRLNEACQLTLGDFIQVNGVEVIRCADLGGGDSEPDAETVDAVLAPAAPTKRRKNENATRRVPIHSELIRLGLGRWVRRRLDGGEHSSAQLFPELQSGRDGHGQGPSKWFARYRASCGIKGEQRWVFHSFRHNFISGRLNHGMPEHQVAAIAGHEAKLVTGKTYWNDKDAEMLKRVVDLIGLPEAVGQLIPVVEDVTFKRVVHRPPSRLGKTKTREKRIVDATVRRASKGP